MIPAVLIYLLKANIALALVFLAYRLGLRRLTFYTLNRIFLLIGIVISSAFPLVNINPYVARHKEIGQVLTYVPDFSQLHQQQFNYWNILVYIFWAGVLVMLVRTLVQSFSMWRIHKSAVNGEIEGTPVKLLNKAINPFSFFRNIYVNPRLHQPQELHDILNHKQVHVRQWHSVDVVLGEINNIFYWFNPGAWLMKSAIRENLEFITDRYLIRQGIDKKNYQYNLLKISGIPYATAIANNFNFSHLKNRIMMMNKKRSSTFNTLRYVILGAMVGGIVLSLNYSKAAAIIEPLHILPVKDTAVLQDAMITPVSAKSTPAPKAKPVAAKPVPTKQVLDKATKNEVLTMESDAVVMQKDALSKPASYAVQLPGAIKETDDRVLAVTTAPQKMVLKGNAIFFTDNTQATNEIGKSSKTTEAVNPTAKATVKSSDHIVEPVQLQGRVMGVKVAPVEEGEKFKVTIRGASSGISPLYVLDGVVMATGATNEVLKTLNPNSIASMTVLKGESATKIYGEAGKNGVIQIVTKAEEQRNSLNK